MNEERQIKTIEATAQRTMGHRTAAPDVRAGAWPRDLGASPRLQPGLDVAYYYGLICPTTRQLRQSYALDACAPRPKGPRAGAGASRGQEPAQSRQRGQCLVEGAGETIKNPGSAEKQG